MEIGQPIDLPQSSVRLYDLSNYSFGTKNQQPDGDQNVSAQLRLLKQNYERTGLQKTVEAILLVHNHGHPHVLLLQTTSSLFRLPGGPINPGEREEISLSSQLSEKLAIVSDNVINTWNIGECISIWWRPNFETFMYPYIPPHITRPKEEKRIYIVHLPEHFMFTIPKNMKLLAVPLFELYDNSLRYGPIISSIPHIISRFQILYC
jgi:cleavage and polyadenylation specificity factor subunit 5